MKRKYLFTATILTMVAVVLMTTASITSARTPDPVKNTPVAIAPVQIVIVPIISPLFSCQNGVLILWQFNPNLWGKTTQTSPQNPTKSNDPGGQNQICGGESGFIGAGGQ